MSHGIILHEEYRERMKKLSPEDLGKIIKNMFLIDDGEEVESLDNDYLDLLSETVCGRLERDIAKSDVQRANRLGKTKNNQTKTKKNQSKTKAEPKKTPITNNQLPITNNQYIKRPYGECANVLLTDEEHDKIIAEGLTGLIDELSLYIASKGDKYKSHYAVIKQWANRRKKEQEEKKVIRTNQFTDGVRTREIDFSDLEKRLIKN